MKVYLVEDYIYDENHIFSTLDKAKEFCYELIKDCEGDFFDKEKIELDDFGTHTCFDYDCDIVADIIPYELDEG